MNRRWWVEGAAVAAIFLIVAVEFTWPLGRHLTESIPAGSEPPTVSMHQLFIVEWSGLALDKGGPYWDAPYFYPHPGAFAWSEPQPFSSVLIWLIAKFTGYILAYNVVIISYLVGFGLAGYAIARLLTQDRAAALWTGVWLTAGAHSLQQFCVLNLVAAGFPTACFFFSFLFAKNKQRRFLWLASVLYILTWATCEQYGLFLTILLPVALLPALAWDKLRWPTVGSCLLAAVVAVAPVLPYCLWRLPLLKQMGFERRLGDIRGGRVFGLGSLFMPAKGHWLTTHILGWGNSPSYQSWDVGVIPLLVIVLSICLGGYKLRSLNAYQKKLAIGLAAMVIAALSLGVGPKIGVVIKGTNFSPYSFLFSIVPGLNVIRSPARLGMFVALGIAVVSAPALAYVRSRMKAASAKSVITIALFVFLSAEMWTMPIALVRPDDGIRDHRKVINWLRRYGGNRLVLELPIPEGLRPVDTEPEVWAMYRMLRHENPIVNGYSAFFPTPFKQLKRAMGVDPAGRGRRYIDAYGVRYVLLHKHDPSFEQLKNLREALGDIVVYSDDNHAIYVLPEKGHIQDAKEFLPAKAEFQQKIPKRGKIYGLPLLKPIVTAMLIRPQPDWWIDFNWVDESGQRKTKKVRMLGSVLLDVDHSRLYVGVLRFPQGGGGAEARLVSAEEVLEILQRQQGGPKNSR